MVNLEVLKQQVNRKKDLNKKIELMGQVGGALGLSLIVALMFVPQFTFLPFLMCMITVEAGERFIKKTLQNKMEDSDVMNGIMSKMTLDSLENAVVSRYILQKLSMINSKTEFSQNLRHNTEGELKEAITSFSRKFSRKFKKEVEISFNDFTPKDYLLYAKKNNIESGKLLREIGDFQVDLNEFKADNLLTDKDLPNKTSEQLDIEDSMKKVVSANFMKLMQKIEFLNKEKLDTEQTALLNDVKTDVETIQRIYQKLNNATGRTLQEGRAQVEEIVNNCLQIAENLKQEQDEDILKDIKVLDKHVNKKVMKMKV